MSDDLKRTVIFFITLLSFLLLLNAFQSILIQIVIELSKPKRDELALVMYLHSGYWFIITYVLSVAFSVAIMSILSKEGSSHRSISFIVGSVLFFVLMNLPVYYSLKHWGLWEKAYLCCSKARRNFLEYRTKPRVLF